MNLRPALPLLVALAFAAPVVAPAQEGGEEDVTPEDPKAFAKTPEGLWEQVDNFYLNKQWIQTCARLDRLRELGESLKKKKQKAGYAYIRCAAIHMKLKNLNAVDNALELSKELIGDHPDRRPVEAELHRLLARTSLEKKDLSQALAHFEIAAAKHADERKETDASLLLSKYASARYDEGNAKEAQEAVNAALMYYPENRDALKLKDAMANRGKAVYFIGGIGLLVVVLAVVVLARRRPQASYDPYDPYAT
ncbi:MAG: hypothetical protein AB2A00_08075 [Myxococcota bacterium]